MVINSKIHKISRDIQKLFEQSIKKIYILVPNYVALT